MLSHTRTSHMSIRIWDVPYAYGPIYAYGAEQYHGGISRQDAETILMREGQSANFLIRKSAHSPGNYVITAQADNQIFHIKIEKKMGKFDLGCGRAFNTLKELVENFMNYPIVTTCGTVINLETPLKSSRIMVSTIEERTKELFKTYSGTYGKSGFYEEFEQLQIQEDHHLHSHKEGARLENKTKNRCKYILPCDHSRVVLKGVSSKEVSTDYINASYINGVLEINDRQYIATQGCLPNTVNDFWHMIYQEGTKIIMMTDNEIERGRSRCTCYWPRKGHTQVYGSIFVCTTYESKNSFYIKRQFIMYHKEQCKKKYEIFQFHFTSWPKYGEPQETSSVLEFLYDMNQKYQHLSQTKIKPGPIVVHCGTGIGRTGTFIAIDILLNSIPQNVSKAEIDIQETVLILRSQRCNIVQTAGQYRFIYLAIVDFVVTKRKLRTFCPNYVNMTF